MPPIAPLTPAPIWKMRSLLFLLVWARAAGESAAMPAVRMTPFLRKVRRVTGEIWEVWDGFGEFSFVFMEGDIMEGGGVIVKLIFGAQARTHERAHLDTATIIARKPAA